ncbi:hypothetical protein PSGE105469_22770 [Pseudomonas gessardii]
MQRASGRAVVGIAGDHIEAFGQRIYPTRRGMRLGAGQGVAVADHPGGRVKAGDGQGIAQAGGDRLREADDNTAGHHADTAHGQVLQTVHGRHAQAAGAGQCASVGAAAIHQVFFIEGQVGTIHADATDHHRVVVVVHVQHQVGGAAVAIGVGQGVGEGFAAIAAAVQRDKIRVGGVQRVGVAAIGRQHQGAVLAGECTTGDRATGDAVGALGVVVQDVADKAQQAFRCAAFMAVSHRLGDIVDNRDIQRTRGGIVVAIGGNHRKIFAEAVGAGTRRMGLIARQCVAVADHPGGRVIPGNTQGIAQPGGNALREAAGHPAADHVDAAHRQALQAIGRRDVEGAALHQCHRVAGRTLGKMGLVERQFAAFDLQPAQAHRVVGGHHHGLVVAGIWLAGDLEQRKLRNRAKPCRGKADNRLHPPGDFSQQHKGVPTAQFTRRRAAGLAGGRGFGGLGWVGPCGNGFLQLLHIGQLRLARGEIFRGMNLRRLAGQQLRGKTQAAVAPQGQLLAVGQLHRYRTGCAGLQLLAGKQSVAFDQATAAAIPGHGKDFPNHLADNTD